MKCVLLLHCFYRVCAYVSSRAERLFAMVYYHYNLHERKGNESNRSTNFLLVSDPTVTWQVSQLTWSSQPHWLVFLLTAKKNALYSIHLLWNLLSPLIRFCRHILGIQHWQCHCLVLTVHLTTVSFREYVIGRIAGFGPGIYLCPLFIGYCLPSCIPPRTFILRLSWGILLYGSNNHIVIGFPSSAFLGDGAFG